MATLGALFNGRAKRLRRAGAVLALLQPSSGHGAADRHPGSTLDQVLNELENIGCLDALTPNGRADKGAVSRISFETDHTLKILLREETDQSTYTNPVLRRDYLSVTRQDEHTWTWQLRSSHFCDFSRAAAESVL